MFRMKGMKKAFRPGGSRMRRYMVLFLSVMLSAFLLWQPEGSTALAAEKSGVTDDGLCYEICDSNEGETGYAVITSYRGQSTVVVIPEKIEGYIVTEIRGYAFWNDIGLLSVKIPSSVTTIGDAAFEGCSDLMSVEIPSGVTTIGYHTFYGCTSLTNVKIPSSVMTIGEGAFLSCTGLTSVEIPSSVTTIGELAFSDCTSLTSVKIPSSVTTIGDRAFFNCTSLTSVEIPSGVTTIGELAFYYCTSLASVEIPSSVTTIGDCAFFNCTSLTSVEIPSSVTTIGGGAFSFCDSLTSVEIPSSVTTIGDDPCYSCEGLISVTNNASCQFNLPIGRAWYLKGTEKKVVQAISNGETAIRDDAWGKEPTEPENPETPGNPDNPDSEEPDNPESYETVYNGVDYSAVYDYDYYLSVAENSDVKAAFGSDDAAVLAHFVNCGMSEGRLASAEFDVKVYKANNKDLRNAFGDDLRAYYMHYIHFGKAEKENGNSQRNAAVGTPIITPDPEPYETVYDGVDYGAVYNYDYYIANNSDVKNAFGDNDAAVLEHFVNNGMSEGRLASAEFDVNVYKENNKDLRNAFGDDLRAYYMHYIHFGKAEKENGNSQRNAAVGTPIVPSENVHGTVYNGVDYSAVYNYDYYIANNSDVKNAFGDNDAAVLEHFVNNGMSEGRTASGEFQPEVYKNNYKDLRNAFGDDLKKYYEHYMNYGKAEGRNAVTALPQEPDDNAQTYSDVFDASYYRDNNRDVAGSEYGASDGKLLEHFVNYGMNEGRQACGNFNPKVYKANNGDLQAAFGDDWRKYYEHYMNYGKNESHRVTK